MEESKVISYISRNKQFFPEEAGAILKEKLTMLPPEKEISLELLNYKEATITLIFSLFLGYLGVDRFYIGDKSMGITKLLFFLALFALFILGTLLCIIPIIGALILLLSLIPLIIGGLFFVIPDWFRIMGITRRKNLEKFMSVVG